MRVSRFFSFSAAAALLTAPCFAHPVKQYVRHAIGNATRKKTKIVQPPKPLPYITLAASTTYDIRANHMPGLAKGYGVIIVNCLPRASSLQNTVAPNDIYNYSVEGSGTTNRSDAFKIIGSKTDDRLTYRVRYSNSEKTVYDIFAHGRSSLGHTEFSVDIRSHTKSADWLSQVRDGVVSTAGTYSLSGKIAQKAALADAAFQTVCRLGRGTNPTVIPETGPLAIRSSAYSPNTIKVFITGLSK
jgi:hypothetical protein